MEATQVSKLLKKLQYIYTHTHTHTMESYSAMKNNEILPFTAMWMDLEIIIQSKARKRKTNIVY